jgi:diguanylate cyclase (GGDEF)-like protein
MFDLDGFKAVNDTRGHLTGDALLRAVGSSVEAILEEGDIIARFGGDEFAILKMLDGDTPPSPFAERVLAAVDEAVQGVLGEQRVGASIGIAAVSSSCMGDEAISKADIALYQGKTAGGRCWRIFDDALAASLRDRETLIADLKEAVERGTFTLHYQPQVDLRDDGLTGFEALIRWHHHQRGTIPPSVFIPLAEETGLIIEIGTFVLRRACIDAARWPEDIDIAVNVSARQFEESDLVAIVEQALRDSGLTPYRLTLEITETLLAQNIDLIGSKLAKLRQMGVKVALDDFGTGYSSLSYIRRFPLDKIKIDQSFVSTLPDPESSAIIRAVIGIADSLSLSVVAEGIETAEHATFLRLIGCASGQGYLFGRPEPLHKTEAKYFSMPERAAS